MGLAAREAAAARVSARDATVIAVVVRQTSASAPRNPSVASAPSVVSSILV